MFGFAYNSFQIGKVRELLGKLSNAIFVLKLQAQNQLIENGYSEQNVVEKRLELIELLKHLIAVITLINDPDASGNSQPDVAYIGLATQFIQLNPADVEDRVAELDKIRIRLEKDGHLIERDFKRLDSLQSYLKAEVAESFRDMFRF